MANKYLDLTGLTTFWSKVKTYVASYFTTEIAKVSYTGNGSSSKTISKVTQTNGKVSATFVDISINPSSQLSNAVPITKGGTGATTAEAARTALDVYAKANVYTKTETDTLLNGRVEVVTQLPSTGKQGVIYYVGPSGSGADQYEEHIWDSTNSKFIKVGERSIDLSSYAKKTDFVAITETEINALT